MTSTAKTALPTPDLSALVEGTEADAADVSAPLVQVNTYSKTANERVSVSASDLYVKHLEDAIAVISNHLKLTKLNSGANEQLQIDIDTTGIPNGYVYKANGANSGGWAAEGAGGTSPVDITVTAGENLALRDYVYLDENTMTAYKVDIDNTPLKFGAVRGIVNVGAISNGATGTVRLFGAVSGFSGLTPGRKVWASATAGSYTQTKPDIDAGEKTIVAEIGFATSASEIMVIPNKPAQYIVRNGIQSGGSITVTHHTDEAMRTRKVSAYRVAVTNGNDEVSITTPSTNKALRSGSGAGQTITPDAAGATVTAIGQAGGNFYRPAQSITPTATGFLTQITFPTAANVGTPLGLVRWSLRTDNASKPSTTILQYGDIVWTASSTITITLKPTTLLVSGTKYWFVLEPSESMPAASYFSNYYNTGGAYAGGAMLYDLNFTDTWSLSNVGWDMRIAFTLSAAVAYDRFAQSFQVSSGVDIAHVDFELRKVGNPGGTLSIRIETDNAGAPSGTLVDQFSEILISETTLTDLLADNNLQGTSFYFPSIFPLSATTTYWVVISTDRATNTGNYVVFGCSTNSYADGTLLADSGSGWTDLTIDILMQLTSATDFIEEPILLTSGATGGAFAFVEFGVFYGDGSGANPDTQTTFVNLVETSAADLVCIVEL